MRQNSKNQEMPDRLKKIVGTATVLNLLYFGREILIPITLAIILSCLVIPLVRGLRRTGLGHIASVGVSVLVLTLGLSAIGVVIGSQIIRTAASLPQYEDTIRGKLRTLDQFTLGKLYAVAGQADRVINQMSNGADVHSPGAALEHPNSSREVAAPVLVEMQEPTPKAIQVLTRIIAPVWIPVETTGIVFVVLVFVLLEHESLRDRFIRLVGQSNLRATTVAVNDAGARLSRFFVSQFSVNFVVGASIWICLAIAGVPHAMLWGGVAALLRFVPYVGVWIAAFGATLLAAAISPGWTLAVLTLLLFVVVEILISQVVEPRLYGHATGLSPLSVVISAIFWGWIWGPVGLVLSTPLTLCLVVAGRHIEALHFLDVLLGEVPALTMPENIYQRALSGDAQEMIAGARRYLKRKSFSAYCDAVLIPALHLAHTDFTEDTITKAEQLRVNSAITSMLVSLEDRRKWWQKNYNISVLEDVTAARHLRARREKLFGQWQGPLDVPAGSVVLAMGLGSPADELAAELLVRVLRAEEIDSRHLSLDELENPPPAEISPELVSLVCIVSLWPLKEHDKLEAANADILHRLPQVKVMALCLFNPFEKSGQAGPAIPWADQTTHSYEETLQSCARALQKPLKQSGR